MSQTVTIITVCTVTVTNSKSGGITCHCRKARQTPAYFMKPILNIAYLWLQSRQKIVFSVHLYGVNAMLEK